MSLRYLSVCSGIEAATCAWHSLGWTPVAFAEVEPFPSAVLAHHYPSVPNWGDMTRFQEWPSAAVDVLVGGTPCQSFSVAGLRKGLADPRGNLALTYLAIADRYRPEWLVWENVPGVLSANGGRDFGAFLGGLGELGYGFAYRVLDAQYFGLAQRRARVFVVASARGWQRAAAVLLERASLLGHPAPRRETGQGTPAGTLRSTDGGSDVEHARARHLVMASGQGGAEVVEDGAPTLTCLHEAPIVAHALRAEGFDASEDGTGRGTPIVPVVEPYALAIRGRGDASVLEARQDGTANAVVTPNGGRAGINVGAVAYALGSHAGAADGDQTNRSHASGGPVGLGVSEELAYTIRNGRGQNVAAPTFVPEVADPLCANEQRTYTHEGEHNFRTRNVIAFGSKDYGADASEDIAPTLRSGNECDGNANGGVPPAIAFNAYQRTVSDVPGPLTAGDDRKLERGVLTPVAHYQDSEFGCREYDTAAIRAGRIPEHSMVLRPQMAVRRLTPRECERLQGFPDDYTLIHYRGKPAADGPRYKALGNSMAVPVMRWIGERIALVEELVPRGEL